VAEHFLGGVAHYQMRIFPKKEDNGIADIDE
jgi:hypothetical protein